eukprot:4072053-Pyramimonas_sp.AAC.2
MNQPPSAMNQPPAPPSHSRVVATRRARRARIVTSADYYNRTRVPYNVRDSRGHASSALRIHYQQASCTVYMELRGSCAGARHCAGAG